MTQTYGPFATGQGAILSAADWGNLFSLIQSSGVVPGVTDELQVVPSSGMTVAMRPGGGWINGFGYRNTEDVELTLNTAHATQARVDRIVLELNVLDSTILPVVLTGTPAASSPAAPTVTQGDLLYQVPLAQIAVGAGATSISSGNITDEREYASANVTQRTRTDWIPAGEFLVTAGTAAISDTMSGSAAGPAALVMTTSSTRVATTWLVPSDWTSGTVGVSLYWAPVDLSAGSGTNTGAVIWTWRYTGPTTVGSTITATSGTLNPIAAPGQQARLTQVTTMPTFTPTAAGQMVGLTFGRSSTGNTFTGNVHFYGIRLDYTGR